MVQKYKASTDTSNVLVSESKQQDPFQTEKWDPDPKKWLDRQTLVFRQKQTSVLHRMMHRN